jgi:hypothetical protein
MISNSIMLTPRRGIDIAMVPAWFLPPQANESHQSTTRSTSEEPADLDDTSPRVIPAILPTGCAGSMSVKVLSRKRWITS